MSLRVNYGLALDKKLLLQCLEVEKFDLLATVDRMSTEGLDIAGALKSLQI